MADLRRCGVPVDGVAVDGVAVRAGTWLLDVRAVPAMKQELTRSVEAWAATHPLDAGMPLSALASGLGIAPELVLAIVVPPLRVESGRVTDARATLPAGLLSALEKLEAQLSVDPFRAPDAARLAELGFDRAALAAAVRAGRLLRLADGVVLLPGVPDAAAKILSGLPQPFTTSEARVGLSTSRRVVLPLLALLDEARLTRRLPDDRREVIASIPAGRRIGAVQEDLAGDLGGGR